MQQIDTGYKPEFALGALYHGMNAANAEDSNEMELIKQFLANQKMQQEMPMDLAIKDLQANQAQMQNTPQALQQFLKGQQGAQIQQEMAGNEATRKNELGNLLQPFARQQMPIEQDSKTRQLQMMNELAQIDQLLGNGGYDSQGNQATPEQMKQWGGLRSQIIERMGQTPELSGKTALEHIKGGYGLEEARIRAAAQEAAAKSGSDADGVRARGQDVQVAQQLEGRAVALEGVLAKYSLKDMDIAALEKIINSNQKPELRQEASRVKELRTQIDTLRRESTAILRRHYPAPGEQGNPAPQGSGQTIKYDNKGNRIQ